MAHEPNLPDFIIAGAPKCGTTSLHHILASHPRIFIPDDEVFFFDLDELRQHRAFFLKLRDEWVAPDLDTDFDRYFRWYQSFFEEADPDQLIGEDSPSYLTSHRAPARIRKLLGDVKLVFMLRDPVDRIYSHYWHDVRHGRRLWSFEKTLTRGRALYYEGSCYEQCLRRYLRVFSDDDIEVVLFEQFVADPQAVVDDLLDFLSPQADLRIDVSEIDTHRNKSKAPRPLSLQLLANRLRHRGPPKQQFGHFPALELEPAEVYRRSTVTEVVSQLAAALLERSLQPFAREEYPPMDEETRRLLGRQLRRENDGLPDLIDTDLGAHWSCLE